MCFKLSKMIVILLLQLHSHMDLLDIYDTLHFVIHMNV